jgi:hypothetical protein
MRSASILGNAAFEIRISMSSPWRTWLWTRQPTTYDGIPNSAGSKVVGNCAEVALRILEFLKQRPYQVIEVMLVHSWFPCLASFENQGCLNRTEPRHVSGQSGIGSGQRTLKCEACLFASSYTCRHFLNFFSKRCSGSK